jgi:hypothetical protein
MLLAQLYGKLVLVQRMILLPWTTPLGAVIPAEAGIQAE